MLTCIACSKQLGSGEAPFRDPDEDVDDGAAGAASAATPSTRRAIKDLTAQIKDMALKASGAYRHCKPCVGTAAGGRRLHLGGYADSEAASGSDRFHYVYRRAGVSAASTPRTAAGSSIGPELEARLRALSCGERTPSVSGRTEASSALEENGDQDEPKEWVAQVEPGILITFLSLPQGGNDLRRIRFSRDMFNKCQAQRWWAENYEKVMELYNVQRFNRQAMPLPMPPRSEDSSSKDNSPMTPPLCNEPPPCNFHLMVSGGMSYSSSDSLEQHTTCRGHGHHRPHKMRHFYDSGGLTSTPKLSSISGGKTETSSMDMSERSSSSPEEVGQFGELSASVSNASDLEREWVEEDEPGVYITIHEFPGGIRELRRVRFSRERFGEMHARLWWEENRARIQQQYL